MDHGNHQKQAKKPKQLDTLAKGYDAIHLQEVHGNRTRIVLFFSPYYKETHWLVYNPHAHDGSGGTVSMYKKFTFGKKAQKQAILVRGRVAFAWFSRNSKSQAFGNVHDFAFSVAD